MGRDIQISHHAVSRRRVCQPHQSAALRCPLISRHVTAFFFSIVLTPFRDALQMLLTIASARRRSTTRAENAYMHVCKERCGALYKYSEACLLACHVMQIRGICACTSLEGGEGVRALFIGRAHQ